MDQLKKIFPLSFPFLKDGGSLTVGILVHIASMLLFPILNIILSILTSPFMAIPVLGVLVALFVSIVKALFSFVGIWVAIYFIIGIVIMIVAFCQRKKECEAAEAPKKDAAPSEKATSEKELDGNKSNKA